MLKLDAVDIKILEILQGDARITTKALADSGEIVISSGDEESELVY